MSTLLALVPVVALVIGIVRGQEVRVDRPGDGLRELGTEGPAAVEEPVR